MPLPADAAARSAPAGSQAPVRIGFVLHVMQVAGAEMLVADIIRRLRGRLTPVVFCLDAVGQLGLQLRAEGIEVVELERQPGLDLGTARRLAREMRDRRIEVMHAHQYTPFFYTALARVIARRPVHVIFTEHGRHYPDVVSGRRRLANRLALTRLADEITGVCRFSIDSLAHVDGFATARMSVVHNGVDHHRYEQLLDPSDARMRAGLPSGRRYLLCAARFHPVKDHGMLVRAFAGVAPQIPDVDLLLAGDGPERGTIEGMARSLGILDRVRFLGVRSDVPVLLQASDAFALTSVSEAASLTVMEAMASAVPVVTTAVGGNPELVRDGVDGLLVPRGDHVAMTAALLRILTDADARRRMGQSARGRILEHFRLEQAVDAYYQRYAAAAERLRAGSAPVEAAS
jgi:glycosyltransferase involved in cell wall biosynthesis